MSSLFSKAKVGSLELQNHLVMSPLTRSRAPGNIPNDLMAEYYGQRATMGLIITEGTSPSPNGLGYSSIPGIYSDEQVAGWKKVTDAVHAKGGKIFVQLMHTGRISHVLNMPKGARIVAPSAVQAAGQIFTAEGMKDHPVPQEMSAADIIVAQAEFVKAATNAVKAGFDGVELHAANGYLLEQFLRKNSNTRTDNYGGSIEGRARFVLEVAEATIAAIGKDKVGIRLSPFGAASDMHPYPEMEADYGWLAGKLNALGLAYVHLVDHSAMGAPAVPASMRATFRSTFKNTLILAGGYDGKSAEADLAAGKADLFAFGRPALANPDLVKRLKTDAALNAPDMATAYAGGAKGYTDYPTLA
ncbi:MAG: alkene reductase [Pseudolabrys sp.]|nr:alkene reductase [Pseudolabrys sp.]